jgi:hypothetical protein
VDGGRIQFTLPFESRALVFEGNQVTATAANNANVDIWEKVEKGEARETLRLVSRRNSPRGERRSCHVCKQHLCEAYREAARAFDQRLREAVEALQPLRALHALAWEQCTRTVLPHVEPLACALRPGQSVGLEELRWIWEHDRAVQALLGGGE